MDNNIIESITEYILISDGFFLIQKIICKYLSTKDICRLMQVNKKFKERYYYIFLKQIPDYVPVFVYKRMFPYLHLYKKTALTSMLINGHNCGFNQDWIIFAIETGDNMIFKYFYDNYRSCVRCTILKIIQTRNNRLLKLVYKEIL